MVVNKQFFCDNFVGSCDMKKDGLIIFVIHGFHNLMESIRFFCYASCGMENALNFEVSVFHSLSCILCL